MQKVKATKSTNKESFYRSGMASKASARTPNFEYSCMPGRGIGNSRRGHDISRRGRDNSKMGRDNSKMGRDNSKMGRDNSRMGRGNSRMRRDISRMGRGNSRMGRYNSRMGRDNSRIGRDNLRMERDNSRIERGNSRMGRGNLRMGCGNLRMRRGNSRMGRDNSRMGRGNSGMERDNSRMGRGNSGMRRDNWRMGLGNSRMRRDNSRMRRIIAKSGSGNMKAERGLVRKHEITEPKTKTVATISVKKLKLRLYTSPHFLQSRLTESNVMIKQKRKSKSLAKISKNIHYLKEKILHKRPIQNLCAKQSSTSRRGRKRKSEMEPYSNQKSPYDDAESFKYALPQVRHSECSTTIKQPRIILKDFVRNSQFAIVLRDISPKHQILNDSRKETREVADIVDLTIERDEDTDDFLHFSSSESEEFEDCSPRIALTVKKPKNCNEFCEGNSADSGTNPSRSLAKCSSASHSRDSDMLEKISPKLSHPKESITAKNNIAKLNSKCESIDHIWKNFYGQNDEVAINKSEFLDFCSDVKSKNNDLLVKKKSDYALKSNASTFTNNKSGTVTPESESSEKQSATSAITNNNEGKYIMPEQVTVANSCNTTCSNRSSNIHPGYVWLECKYNKFIEDFSDRVFAEPEIILEDYRMPKLPQMFSPSLFSDCSSVSTLSVSSCFESEVKTYPKFVPTVQTSKENINVVNWINGSALYNKSISNHEAITGATGATEQECQVVYSINDMFSVESSDNESEYLSVYSVNDLSVPESSDDELENDLGLIELKDTLSENNLPVMELHDNGNGDNTYLQETGNIELDLKVSFEGKSSAGRIFTSCGRENVTIIKNSGSITDASIASKSPCSVAMANDESKKVYIKRVSGSSNRKQKNVNNSDRFGANNCKAVLSANGTVEGVDHSRFETATKIRPEKEIKNSGPKRAKNSRSERGIRDNIVRLAKKVVNKKAASEAINDSRNVSNSKYARRIDNREAQNKEHEKEVSIIRPTREANNREPETDVNNMKPGTKTCKSGSVRGANNKGHEKRNNIEPARGFNSNRLAEGFGNRRSVKRFNNSTPGNRNKTVECNTASVRGNTNSESGTLNASITSINENVTSNFGEENDCQILDPVRVTPCTLPAATGSQSPPDCVRIVYESLPQPKASSSRQYSPVLNCLRLLDEFYQTWYANERQRMFGFERPLTASPLFEREEPMSDMPRRTHVATDLPNDCIICIEAFRDGVEISDLPCGHHFHSDCVAKWFRIGGRFCPVCRKDVLENQPNEQF